MFRGSYQKKLLTILYSGGSNPLEIWDIQVKNGWTRRVKDDDLACIVFEICGTNVATAYIVSPPDPKGVLGIGLPFITMLIKNLKRYFTFEIQIVDDKQMRRRFRFSNYQSSTKVRPFTCSVPLALKPGWNQMQLNLANFTTRAYGTNYIETQRVQIHANCRVRRVYFSDRLYTEEELPRDYRVYLNVRQPPQPQKDPSKEKMEPEESKTKVPPILKETRVSVHSTHSELLAKTSMKSASIAESKRSRSIHTLTNEVAVGEGIEEARPSVHSITSRKSSKSATRSEERRSMSAIAEEGEQPITEIGEEAAEGGEEVEGGGEETKPEEAEPGSVAEFQQESPDESPRLEEDAPLTEDESPRTEEIESPRSEIVESEVAESEPLPESDAEIPESEAEDASPDPPTEEPPAEEPGTE